MKEIIKKILEESDDWLSDTIGDVGKLPFEVLGPTQKPKKTNLFIVKTVWEYGDAYLNEQFEFSEDNNKEFMKLIHVCRFYNALQNENFYDNWNDVIRVAKSVGTVLGSWNDEGYGEPHDISDYVFGGDYPAFLTTVNIFYYDKNGIEHNVRLI